MKFVDVVDITKKALAQTMGANYMEQLGDLSALNSAQLVDIGTTIQNSGTVDQYSKALIGLLAEHIVVSKDFDRRINSIMVDTFEWGSFIERSYIGMTKIMDDPMYNLVDGRSYADIEHTFYQPTVITKIYEEAKAVMTPISIQAEALRDSFRSWDAVNRFLSGVRTSVRATMNYALYVYEHMLLSCGIALSTSPNGLNNAVHLLTESIAEGILPSGSTVADFKKSPDAVRFALRRMMDVEGQMREWSAAYNNHSLPVFASETGKIVLNQFKNIVKTNVLYDSYNRDELSIGDFETVSCWQGIATTPEGESREYFPWNTVSTVSLAADPDGKLGIGTNAYEVSNVVGFVFDRMAIGMTLDRRKVTSQYTASADFWNEFMHQLVNYLIDTTFGMVAFVID